MKNVERKWRKKEKWKFSCDVELNFADQRIQVQKRRYFRKLFSAINFQTKKYKENTIEIGVFLDRHLYNQMEEKIASKNEAEVKTALLKVVQELFIAVNENLHNRMFKQFFLIILFFIHYNILYNAELSIIYQLLSTPTIYHLPSTIYFPPSTICLLSSTINHLPSIIYHLLSTIYHLLSIICKLPVNIY